MVYVKVSKPINLFEKNLTRRAPPKLYNAVSPRPAKFLAKFFLPEIYWKPEVITPEVHETTHCCHSALSTDGYAPRVIEPVAGSELRRCPRPSILHFVQWFTHIIDYFFVRMFLHKASVILATKNSTLCETLEQSFAARWFSRCRWRRSLVATCGIFTLFS